MLAVSRNASSCSSEPFEVVGPTAPTLPATVWYAIVFGSLEFVLDNEVAAAEAAAIPAALHAALAGHFQIEPSRLFVTRLLHGSESQFGGDISGRRLLSQEPWLAEYRAVLPWTAAIVIERFVMDYNPEYDNLTSSFFAIFQFELKAAGMNTSLISVNFTDVKLQRLTGDAANKYLASLQWQENNTGDSNASNEPGEHNSQDLNMTSDELSDTENVSRKLTGLMQAGTQPSLRGTFAYLPPVFCRILSRPHRWDCHISWRWLVPFPFIHREHHDYQLQMQSETRRRRCGGGRGGSGGGGGGGNSGSSSEHTEFASC